MDGEGIIRRCDRPGNEKTEEENVIDVSTFGPAFSITVQLRDPGAKG
jgi:hypothetical protein